VKGEKFKLRAEICLWGLFLLRTRSAHRLHSQHLAAVATPNSTASAFYFFLSTNMVFVAVRTHFPRKNTRVYRISNSRKRHVTCLTPVTSNRVEPHLVTVTTLNIAELVPSGFSFHNSGFCSGLNTFSQDNYPWLCRRIAFVAWKDMFLITPFTTNKKVEFNNNNKVTIKKISFILWNKKYSILNSLFRRRDKNSIQSAFKRCVP